jgi:hypothetical protein
MMTASRLRRSAAALLATAGLVAAGLTAAAPAGASHGHGHAWGHFKGHCRAVHATGVGTDDGAGTTTATLYRGKRAIGTTVGTLTMGVVTDGVAAFTGTIVFTDAAGTLDAPIEGTLDTATGEFMATSDSVTGTGGHQSVTGKLTFRGVEDLATQTFTEVVHGKLCVPKKQPH